jgi:Tol biopolymer transport system component
MPPGSYGYGVYSPDGTRIALAFRENDNIDIGVYDVASKSLTRLTTDGLANERPEWTPDGRRIIYRSTRNGKEALWWQPADGSAPPELLLERPGGVQEGVITPDGKTLIYRTIRPRTGRDILARPLSGDTASQALVATNASESHIAISQDGRFLAYQSNESGRDQVLLSLDRRRDGRSPPMADPAQSGRATERSSSISAEEPSRSREFQPNPPSLSSHAIRSPPAPTINRAVTTPSMLRPTAITCSRSSQQGETFNQSSS